MDREDIDKFVDRLAQNSAQARLVQAQYQARRDQLLGERMAIVDEAQRAGLVGTYLENIEEARAQLAGLYGRVVAKESGVV